MLASSTQLTTRDGDYNDDDDSEDGAKLQNRNGHKEDNDNASSSCSYHAPSANCSFNDDSQEESNTQNKTTKNGNRKRQ